MKQFLQWNVRRGNALVDETWVKSFPEHSKGFDVIIGNPPYVEYSRSCGRKQEHMAIFMLRLLSGH